MSIKFLVLGGGCILGFFWGGGGGSADFIFMGERIFLIFVRAEIREGMRTATFQFSESGGSVNGPNLFTELPFL